MPRRHPSERYTLLGLPHMRMLSSHPRTAAFPARRIPCVSCMAQHVRCAVAHLQHSVCLSALTLLHPVNAVRCWDVMSTSQLWSGPTFILPTVCLINKCLFMRDPCKISHSGGIFYYCCRGLLGRGLVCPPGGFGTRPRYLIVPLAAPIGLSPQLILTLCGSERVLVVSTEPTDDLSCLNTPGVGCLETGCCPCR